jgi:hypothetical protein
MTNDKRESLERLVDIALGLVQAHTEALPIEREVDSLKRQLRIEEVPAPVLCDCYLTTLRSSAI